MTQSLYEFIANGKVTTSNQNNITLTGNLTALAVDGVTILKGNVLANGPIAYFDTVVFFNDVGNIDIPGGNSGQVLTTNGNGVLYWSNGGSASIDVGYQGVLVVNNASALNFRGGIVPAANGSIANINFIGLTTIYFGSYVYGINNPAANTVTTPSNISSFGANIKTANFQVPKYIIGSNVGANYIWPYVQGTSTTSNGYLANSTSSLQPANACLLNITNGTDNWYVLDYTDLTFNGNSYITSDPLQANAEYCFYANVDANIQITQFLTTSTNSTIMIANTASFGQYELKANAPTFLNIMHGGSTSNCDGTGFLIRNMTSNSNVTIMSCFLTAQAVLAPPSIL